MEIKKNRKANLEQKRPIFFQIGLIVAISLSILAFEWPAEVQQNDIFIGIPVSEYEEEIVRATFVKPPLPPAPPVPMIALDLEIVDNLTDIKDPDVYTGDIDDYNFTAWFDNMEDEPEEPEETVFYAVSDMPTFKGGDLTEFHKYVQQHVSFPQIAQEMGIDGKVLVQFIVNKKGEISDITITRSVDPVLDNEVIKVLREAPDWQPGKQFGKTVKVMFNIPVYFKLNR